ncbi:MAG: cupin domain-containing protein [Vicinamibacteria bacterium]
MKQRGLAVLGGMTAAHFLKTYWQRKASVIRGAFPDLKDPLGANELAGLACESHVDSRLVVERGGKKPWEVTRGPQKGKSLERLPRSHWTLLVESMDRHSAAIADFARPFSFLPKWRMDDVMVSLAPLHGTVDAHIDSYDVFLVQGQGRRLWQVDSSSKADYKPGLDLRILKRFRAEAEWTLEPGDMLYVPPGVGHRGVTVASASEVALTYSVGFRAPSSADLLSSLLSQAVARDAPQLFSDRGRAAVEDAGELNPADLEGLRSFLVETLPAADEDAWILAAGEAVTSGGGAGHARTRLSESSIVRRLSAGQGLTPVAGARLSWARLTSGRAALFVNGESRVLPRAQAFAAAVLCGRHSSSSARRIAADPELAALTADLLRLGLIGWAE